MSKYRLGDFGTIMKGEKDFCQYDELYKMISELNKLERQLEKAMSLLVSIDEYLGESGINAVCSTSIYHRQIQDLIEQLKDKGE